MVLAALSAMPRGSGQLRIMIASQEPSRNSRVNEPQTSAELEAICRSVNRGCPFGEMVVQSGFESAMRPLGRPPKLSVVTNEA